MVQPGAAPAEVARNRRGTRLSWSYPCVWPSWHERVVTAARTGVAISEYPGIGRAGGPGDFGLGGAWPMEDERVIKKT
jgi:hypothetical protein